MKKKNGRISDADIYCGGDTWNGSAIVFVIVVIVVILMVVVVSVYPTSLPSAPKTHSTDMMKKEE